MPTELLFSIFVAIFMLTGVGFLFAILFGLSAWCMTEAGIANLRPFRLGWQCGRVLVAVAVTA
jgi:hypothetical protein